ncbi:vacuolar import and degradation protein-domain-containing protein [Xylariomycetidae sp. FL0641]|nr:vacuolar import and degradation protein-domain-containing protein [Xylariomycetidae sp. FL0641]
MPTPSRNPPELPARTQSSSCPDDVRSSNGWRPDQDGLQMNPESREATTSPDPVSGTSSDEMADDPTESRYNTLSPSPDSRNSADPMASEPLGSASPSQKPADAEEDELGDVDTSSLPQHSAGYDLIADDNDKDEEGEGVALVEEDSYTPSMGYDFSNARVMPSLPSTFLRPGSKFHGTQQSERQVYDVQVEIKYVDLRESFLCGLTEDNPTLTTYFEGEIIGSKYGFITEHQGWGASEKTDLSHWGKFAAFRPYSKLLRKGPVAINNLSSKENIFMRWKEHFLVPDHRVTSINGASFEGFYYICFNQKEGSISGIYFHCKSEKFQQLELKHVEDRGCFGAMEFRGDIVGNDAGSGFYLLMDTEKGKWVRR